MCGLLGCFAFKQLSSEEIAATLALGRLMERRGPDDKGEWHDQGSCVLGFRRLTILDLTEAGHQPMISPDGRYVIVYNGEVYNFQELRRDLYARGVYFRSTGDTEVVLQTLVTFGRDGLDRLNGMFALALYDRVERRLLLARDHAGIKPLYYLLTSKGLFFSSQYDQILTHPWSRQSKVSERALGLYLRLGYIPAPDALLEHSHLLEPGSWLEATCQGAIRKGKFFEFPVFREPDLSGEEAYEAVDQAITRAVRRQLVSDVPLGTFLSGGIDSPLVAAKAAAAHNGGLRAFTVGTDDDRDETTDAIAYAEELGLEHVIERATSKLALEFIDDVVAACSEPFGDYSVFPTMLISRAARRHVKVIVSGDGGDELFWGYPSRFVTPIKHSTEFRQARWLRNLRWSVNRAFINRRARHDLRYGSVGRLHRSAHSRISERDLRGVFPDAPSWPDDSALFEYDGCDTDQTAQWLRWNEFVSHLGMVLLKVDRASMHQSLEVRVPLLDREVIDIACRVDWRSCLDLTRRVGKLPLRHALARHVSHQTQGKRGFEAPMRLWLRGPLKEIFQQAVIERGQLLGMKTNRPRLQAMLQQHAAGHADYSRALWMLLSLALWEKRHYQARSPMSPQSFAPVLLRSGKAHSA
jgi:asparagine synthase (glutamine-hydrolysing)